jgi:hypothetical protein
VFAAYEAGVWLAFERDIDSVLDLDREIAERGLAERYVRGVADHLSRRDVWERLDGDGVRYRLSERGRAMISAADPPAS